LTGDNVMVTGGLGYGQMMKLTDWIILADGAKIQEEFIPVPKNGTAHSASGAEFIPVPQQKLAVPQQNPPALGAKFRWTLNPETYRIAIMTTNGLLQVKSVTDGGGECDTSRTVGGTYPLIKKMFADEAEWRASLPAGGSVELTLPAKVAEAQRIDEAYPRLGDVDKIKALLKRYKIRTTTWESGSLNNSLNFALGWLDKMRDELSKLTLEDDLAGRRHRLNLAFNRALRNYISVKSQCDQDPMKAAQKPIHIVRRGTGKIRAMIGGELNILTVHGDKIAATVELHRWGAVKLYNNFAEMGNPMLSIHYRRRTINL
jgi:hypothetical protein